MVAGSGSPNVMFSTCFFFDRRTTDLRLICLLQEPRDRPEGHLHCRQDPGRAWASARHHGAVWKLRSSSLVFPPFNNRRIEHTRDCITTISHTDHRSFSSFRKFSIFLRFPHPQSLVCARMLAFVSSVFSFWKWFISLMILMPQGLSHVFAEPFPGTHIAFRESSNPQNKNTAFHSLLTTGVWSGNPHRESPWPRGSQHVRSFHNLYSENCINRCIFGSSPANDVEILMSKFPPRLKRCVLAVKVNSNVAFLTQSLLLG